MNPIRSFPTLSTALAEIKGGFRRYTIVRSIDREKGLLKRWTILSPGRLDALVRYLWGKWLWDELSQEEYAIFLSMDIIFKAPTIYLSLKAKLFGVSKKDIRHRLETLHNLMGTVYVSREQYLSIKANCTFFFVEEDRPLASVPKYSGYTRHYRDQGSLSKIRPDMVSDFVEVPSFVDQDRLIFEFLTVGEIISSSGQVFFLPEDDSKKNRNGKKNQVLNSQKKERRTK